uniref:Protein kinase domain-containing protein n=1 Tax=Kalanchoe fedtschenkoi TaxID=63787 RepID=A0A7N0VMK0_KALFE
MNMRSLNMISRREHLLSFILFFLLAEATVSDSSKLPEFDSFYKFIEAVDPYGVLGIISPAGVDQLNPCSNKWKGVTCNLEKTGITELRFENMNLSGIIDAKSLCELPLLRLLNLANNRIHGSVPEFSCSCKSLRYLNISGNPLSEELPRPRRMRNLRCTNVSERNNNQDSSHAGTRVGSHAFLVVRRESTAAQESSEAPLAAPPSLRDRPEITKFVLIPGIVLFILLTYVTGRKAVRLAEERDILKALGHESPAAKIVEEVKQADRPSELVFFVEEHERFKLEDLLESAADLQSQTLCSSLYKVMIQKNSIVYAVKRLKKLQVSSAEFSEAMSRVGALNHPNILPLIGYNSTDEEKLLIYKYQKNGSLLMLLENYIEGKKSFSWSHRLAMIWGITKGLTYLHQSFDDQEVIIPHGNLKLSNVLLSESEEAVISEYGVSRFVEQKRVCPLSAGYRAPEKELTEEGDVYSFGVILLELLTSKLVERSGLDLPKWVRSVVREEWTGEVFDKEVHRGGNEWAFPLLNIALKCVSQVAGDRPSMGEVYANVERVVLAQHESNSISPAMPIEIPNYPDYAFLHQVISDSWDTPASNC